jgi:hypothetical protein
MTILRDLLLRTNFERVRASILRLYPDQDINIDGYKNVFEKLMTLKPFDKGEKWKLELRKCKSILNENETYWDISGLWLNSTDPEQLWGLSYTPWDQWLAMEVDEKQVNMISVSDFLAHCLYEMTYCGFDEAAIKQSVDDFSKTVEYALSEGVEVPVFDMAKSAASTLDDVLDDLLD